MVLSSCETEWDFMQDELIAKAVDDAVRRYVALFEGVRADDARHDAILYLVEHPVLLNNYRRDGDAGSLYYNLYTHALRNPVVRDRNVSVLHYGELADELGVSDEDALTLTLRHDRHDPEPTINTRYYLALCKTDEERERVQDVIDRYVEADGDSYTKDKVRQIVGLCFAPSMLGSWASPFGNRPVDPNAARKSKGDPSHRYTDAAELADIRKAFAKCDISLREKRVLLLRFAMDYDKKATALTLGMDRGTVAKDEESAIEKLTAFLNGKGRDDLPA